jgi:hypothetical protein
MAPEEVPLAVVVADTTLVIRCGNIAAISTHDDLLEVAATGTAPPTIGPMSESGLLTYGVKIDLRLIYDGKIAAIIRDGYRCAVRRYLTRRINRHIAATVVGTNPTVTRCNNQRAVSGDVYVVVKG